MKKVKILFKAEITTPVPLGESVPAVLSDDILHVAIMRGRRGIIDQLEEEGFVVLTLEYKIKKQKAKEQLENENRSESDKTTS